MTRGKLDSHYKSLRNSTIVGSTDSTCKDISRSSPLSSASYLKSPAARSTGASAWVLWALYWPGGVGSEETLLQSPQLLEHNLDIASAAGNNQVHERTVPTTNGVRDLAFLRGPLCAIRREAGRVAVLLAPHTLLDRVQAVD